MSKIAEMVEAEARRAESEPEPEPGEPEPAPEPSEPEPEASMQKALEKFEAENTRHEKALAKIMGEDFEAFALCDACSGVGFRPALPFPHDPMLATCEACEGQGFMLTGSLREDKRVRDCMVCAGNGYITRAEAPPQPAPAGPPTPLYDQYTGLPLTPEQVANGANRPEGWAPGYVPPGRAAPGAPLGA